MRLPQETAAMRTDTALVTMLAASLAACSPTTEEAAPAETAEAAPPAIAAFSAGENVSPFAVGSLQAASLRDAAFSPVNDNMTLAINQSKADVDALLTAAVRDRRLIQATAYVVESKEIDQSGFFARLQQKAISVKKKTLKIRADGSMKGDWDMEMAMDMLDAAPQLDVLALVSGDGDFTSLVKRLKSMGPRVEVLGFPRNTAKSLLEAADRFQPLDRHFMIRESGATRKTSTKKNSQRSRETHDAKDRETARAV